MAPVIVWFRRDFRLSDHEALSAAVESGQPVIPVFIHDEHVETLGAAPALRLEMAVECFAKSLDAKGSKLILRRGKALDVLRDLIKETGADTVHWSRSYDPTVQERDKAVKTGLKGDGVTVESFTGHLLFEPWTVSTKDGGFYKVYSPMWRAVRDREVPPAIPAPDTLTAPDEWPASDTLADWALSAAMRRGREIVASYQTVGEEAAQERLAEFIETRVDAYKDERDFPARESTSRLSENLTVGEISPRQIWHAGWRAVQDGKAGAEHFLKELVWREFAYHLLHHTPRIADRNWREEWDRFPWNEDGEREDVIAWKQGRTGEPFVDAAMREMYVTGTMHNRARMIVASYLTKHLLTDWRIGQKWFEDCLTDWDPAANAMGWQWAAGCGPDAAPYFRIFNPETQLKKFDPKAVYRRKWIGEGEARPSETATSYFEAIPVSWDLSLPAAYPERIVDLAEGRKRALDAYEQQKA